MVWEIVIKEKRFGLYLSNEVISRAIAEIAEKIRTDYKDKNPLLLAILNGSFMFASDLFKQLDSGAEITFVKVASYKGTSSTGNVTSLIGLDMDIAGRNVIIVEDIVDTGKTLSELLPTLKHAQPATLEIATLLQKPDALKFPVDVKYCGIEIPDKFIVGYGLDYDGLGRNLPDIYQVI